MGLNVADIAQTLRRQFHGFTATRFCEAERDRDIFPRLAEALRRDVTDLANTVTTTRSSTPGGPLSTQHRPPPGPFLLPFRSGRRISDAV